jgi:hypothetical protein
MDGNQIVVIVVVAAAAAVVALITLDHELCSIHHELYVPFDYNQLKGNLYF